MSINEQEAEGLELLQKFVNDYKKVAYPSVDDELLITLVKGLKLLNFNYVISPEDDLECPDCGYIHGKVGKNGISLHTSFGNNVLCIYCSCEHEYDEMLKHNMADCDCPDQSEKDTVRQWCKQDCLCLYEGFEKYYKDILKELFDE